MNTNSVSKLSGQAADFLSEIQKEQQELPGGDANLASTPGSLVQTDIVNISSEARSISSNSNMMSRNFSGGYERDTKYIDANDAGNAAVQRLEASMQSSMTSILEAVGLESEAVWYDNKKMKNAKIMKDTTESHKEVFDRIEANIEERAAEAIAPKDENGEPIEQAPAASANTASAAAVAQAVDVNVEVEINLDGIAAAAEALPSLDVIV